MLLCGSHTGFHVRHSKGTDKLLEWFMAGITNIRPLGRMWPPKSNFLASIITGLSQIDYGVTRILKL